MANDAVNKYAPYSLKKKKEDAPYMEKIAVAFFISSVFIILT